MFQRQLLHLVLLTVLLSLIVAAVRFWPALVEGSWLGVSTGAWLLAAIAVPVLHQVYVAWVWRAQLYRGLVSRWLGSWGFPLYAVGFQTLFVGRLAALAALAWSNRGTLPIAPGMGYVLAALLAVPWLYAVYSVGRYFGLARAMGLDHFDPSYRTRPFVRQGIFRWTRNGMYGYAFLAVWLPGLLTGSLAALLAGGFQHLYIWVHYYVTELPDIRQIYGAQPPGEVARRAKP